MRVLRNLDLVLLALALPVFIAGDLPLLGYVTAAAVWVVQRLIRAELARRAAAARDARTSVGLNVGGLVGRGWLVALTIFAVGLADNDAGLSAAVLFIVLFTVYFTVHMFLRPFEREEPLP